MKIYKCKDYIHYNGKIVPKHKILNNSDLIVFEGSLEECFNHMDKKVIIVAPSPHLIDKNLGEQIDSYDIIVRTNNSYLIDRPEDYGSRTDMLFINKMWERNNQDKIPFIIEKYGNRNVIFKDNTDLSGPKGYQMNTNRGSNMGVITILHLINMGYVNITLTGYSFYQNHPFYLEEYYKDQKGMVLNGESHPQKKTVLEINNLIKLGYVKLLEDSQYYFDIVKRKYL